ncbi:MAG: hypothetical protein EZS28_017928 [Streblomastix strix]|uniref:Uncharacterized protein n=1 Tax=Streblomastix strix TaxID=222440 RepID=A0A5J4VWJ4_9EUKA|nr:MAG: hypothetical protein EZS28_017928 [Streblomastix strix]
MKSLKEKENENDGIRVDERKGGGITIELELYQSIGERATNGEGYYQLDNYYYQERCLLEGDQGEEGMNTNYLVIVGRCDQ